ncbi:MAG TPA: peptidylprolyl isomerase [Nitrosopumilaceae archaeon]|nr:peptidylprolyl isomerase [Nitrosopumilaceae archaeon]
MRNLFLIFVFGFLLLSITNNSYAQSEQVIVLETTSGNIVIELFEEDAPKTVENFLNLTNSGFYDDVIFHRIIKGFMIQSGDPLSKDPSLQSQWGTGDSGQNIDAEFNTIKHLRGIVSMARAQDPNSASSQFFIVHEDSDFLDQQYTVFGRIITQESFDTLDKIASLETGPRDIPTNTEQAKILSAKVVPRSEISGLLELGEPERVIASTPETPSTQPTEVQSEQYVNNRLGFGLLAPTGWIVQEPQKTSPDVPDVVFVGPKDGEINPVISIGVFPTEGKTLQQIIDERRATIQPAIDSGNLEIISDNVGDINGREAWVIQALGGFQSQQGLVIAKFAEVMIHTFENVYIITYTNDEVDFEDNVQHYEKAINSFTLAADMQEQFNEITQDDIEVTTSTDETNSEGGGCLIATATYGSELVPQVQQLRELRDEIVLETESGTAFMKSFNQFYYSFSPTIADMERENPVFKEAVKISITPLLASLSILNHVDIDSEQEMLGYGIGVILMNVGMYFAAPAIIIYRLKK